MAQHFDLLENCKRGDARAQRMLYDIFKAKLMGLSRRYTRRREEAEDVLQESFIKIFNNINTLQSPEKLESWMKSTVVHTAINHYHKAKKKDLMFTPISTETEAAEPIAENPTYTDEMLIAAVNELPDGCRLIFNLYAVEGYSHQEIAALLKITDNTSRSQYHYAKVLLKKKLNCQDLTHYYEKFA